MSGIGCGIKCVGFCSGVGAWHCGVGGLGPGTDCGAGGPAINCISTCQIRIDLVRAWPNRTDSDRLRPDSD